MAAAGTDNAKLPPPQPSFLLRGHAATVQSLCFARRNTRIVTGDADGWVVVWNAATRRSVASWRAHGQSPVLGVSEWDDSRLLTHGRDGKLCVWELAEKHEAGLSAKLPVDFRATKPPVEERVPWLLHSLPASTLSFCGFANCTVSTPKAAPTKTSAGPSDGEADAAALPKASPPSGDELVVAFCGAQSDTAVELYLLPSERHVGQIPGPDSDAGKTGMLMAVGMTAPAGEWHNLVVAAGYESGRTCLFRQADGQWQVVYSSRPHDQPILSLDVDPAAGVYLTSSADATLAKHLLSHATAPQTSGQASGEPLQTTKTGHAGQQALRVRSDAKIFATAGWDGRGRVYSAKTLRELAVLKWHKQGCYALAFAEVFAGDVVPERGQVEGKHPAALEAPASQGAIDGAANGKESGSTRPIAAGHPAEMMSRGLLAALQAAPAGFRVGGPAGRATVSEQRAHRVQTTHWVALGCKDGTVSVWQIY